MQVREQAPRIAKEAVALLSADNCPVGENTLIPVSYTHLDVYKRQVYHPTL